MADYLDDIRQSYDTVAPFYAELVRERARGEDEALNLLAELAVGPVVDAGCGPGRLAGRLCERGMQVVGVDLSPVMIGIARRDHPSAYFAVASMTALPFRAGGLGAVIAWWSLIHLPRAAVSGALGGFHRALAPGGVLVLGFHAGTGSTHKTSGYGGHAMNVDVHRWQPDELTHLTTAAGFMPYVTAELPEEVLCFRRPGSA